MMHEAPGRPPLDVIDDYLDVDRVDFGGVFAAHLLHTRQVQAKYVRMVGEDLYRDWDAIDAAHELAGVGLAAFEAGGRGV